MHKEPSPKQVLIPERGSGEYRGLMDVLEIGEQIALAEAYAKGLEQKLQEAREKNDQSRVDQFTGLLREAYQKLHTLKEHMQEHGVDMRNAFEDENEGTTPVLQ